MRSTVDVLKFQTFFLTVRDFPRPDLRPNIGPFPIQNEQKLPKMVYIIPNFLVLHFGENFMKIQTKIAKLQMHENLHKIFVQIFMSFHEGHMLQLYTANFFYGFNPFKSSPVLLDCIKFPNFDGSNYIFPNSIGPWPPIQKGRKIPVC